MKKSWWKGKKILVTGASGFIGAALTAELREQGGNVLATSRSPKGSGVIAADVSKKRDLEALFSRGKLFACFHLAGESLVEHGKASPYSTFKNNILGTLNVLELCKKHRITRVLISSTVHVYGDARAPAAEDVSPRPSRPYETSKTCADLIAQSYADSYHLPVLIPRFVNIYGPGDTNFSRLIPKTIRSIILGQAPLLWGGSVKRDFLYIDDAIRAFLLLAQIEDSTLEKNRIFNFGTGEIISIRDLVQTIVRLACSPLRVVPRKNGREQEIAQQYVTWEKAKRILGWEPRVGRTEGLRRTISWYRDYFKTQHTPMQIS